MPDVITLRGLELRTRIGMSAEERTEPQRVLMDVEMTVDIRAAAASDDVGQSVDYAAVAVDLKALEQTERKTIERLADDAADLILKRHKPSSVTVTVMKFPPIGTERVEVRITRP